jgi:hypothetical protein
MLCQRDNNTVTKENGKHSNNNNQQYETLDVIIAIVTVLRCVLSAMFLFICTQNANKHTSSSTNAEASQSLLQLQVVQLTVLVCEMFNECFCIKLFTSNYL